jgi:hypothetical protein
VPSRAPLHYTRTTSWRTAPLLDINESVPKPHHEIGRGTSGEHAAAQPALEEAHWGVVMTTAQLRIVGRRLPGASWSGRHGIHVGVQCGVDVVGLVTGDAADAVFDIDLDVVVGADGRPDFRGPYVHGRRGERFVYLSWGEVDDAGTFAMFRRLKLHLAPLVEQSPAETLLVAKKIQAVLELTDTRGRPLAASVRPPWVTWRVTNTSRG